MQISEIYSHFQIPPNLQRHMFEVAAVASRVVDHWLGPEINKTLIIQASLLHDVGNIVKFKRPFLGELEADAIYWEQVQDEMKKYGDDAFTTTHKMLESAQINPEIITLVGQMPEMARKSGEYTWEVRICDYADCFVSPDGIVGTKLRLLDLQARYPTESNATWQAIRKNKTVVEHHLDTSIEQVSLQDWQKRIQTLQEMDIETESAKI